MQRRNVDLPEPDGPRRQTTSPRLDLEEMPLSTSSRPKLLWTASAVTMGRLTRPARLGEAAGMTAAPQTLQRRQSARCATAPRPKWRSM